MDTKEGKLWKRCAFILLLGGSLFQNSSFGQAPGQTTLNVANFGAVGDAEGLTVSCVSNSNEYSIISTNWGGTNYAPKIGDVIEVFRAGPWLSFSNDPPYMTVPFYGRGNANTYVIVTNQDIICLITNITEGTNLWCPIAAGWTMSAYCVVGTNNSTAFQSAVDTASNLVSVGQATNVTIAIPAGTYLLIPSNVLNPNFVLPNIAGPEGDNNECAVRISSGGITLSGDSAADTVLMGCGAGMEHDLNNSFPYGNGYFNPFRGEMFLTGNNAGGGIGVMNNQYPLVFENLTCDGGLTNGYCPDNQYWILTPGNGDGWDTTHHVALDFSYDQGQMHQLKIFQNCIFQHWRGEMLISGVGNGGTNTFICVTNCVFNDGCASGFNFTFANSIVNCVFTNLVKVLEFYQSYATQPCLFESNVCSVPGESVEFTIVGSVTNVQPQPPWYIFNNTFSLNVGQTAIQLSPAENVVISNNDFTGSGNATAINFDSAGVQPSDGSATVCSNIDIVNNTANLSFGSLVIFAYYEQNCLISNNVLQAGALLDTWYSGFATNNLVVDNQDPGGEFSLCGIQNGQYPQISSNNVFGSLRWDLFYPSTNEIDWCDGNNQHWDLNWTGSIWYLGTNSLIPPNSFLSLSNGSGGPLQIYYDSSRTTYTNIPNLTTAVLQWNGSGWAAPATSFASTNATATNAVPPHPYISSSNGQLILSWPTNTTTYTLQYATNLTPPINWIPVFSAPVIIQGQDVQTAAMVGAAEYFRLVQ
jgi:hypothetical protein